jgi:hypothetical protein
MPSLPDSVKKGAGVAASVLETTAGVLRGVAGSGGEQDPKEREEQRPPEQSSQQKPAEAKSEEQAKEPTAQPASRGTKPAAATRQRIANPKAAKKVRARQG